MNYWQEAASEALDAAGVIATQEQFAIIGEFLEGCHDNYGMAMGHECIPNPLQTEVDSLERKLKSEQATTEQAKDDFRNNVAMRWGVTPQQVTLEKDGQASVRP